VRAASANSRNVLGGSDAEKEKLALRPQGPEAGRNAAPRPPTRRRGRATATRAAPPRPRFANPRRNVLSNLLRTRLKSRLDLTAMENLLDPQADAL
jgi:hypothetical protein